jgi:hypothetical protein
MYSGVRPKSLIPALVLSVGIWVLIGDFELFRVFCLIFLLFGLALTLMSATEFLLLPACWGWITATTREQLSIVRDLHMMLSNTTRFGGSSGFTNSFPACFVADGGGHENTGLLPYLAPPDAQAAEAFGQKRQHTKLVRQLDAVIAVDAEDTPPSSFDRLALDIAPRNRALSSPVAKDIGENADRFLYSENDRYRVEWITSEREMNSSHTRSDDYSGGGYHRDPLPLLRVLKNDGARECTTHFQYKAEAGAPDAKAAFNFRTKRNRVPALAGTQHAARVRDRVTHFGNGSTLPRDTSAGCERCRGRGGTHRIMCAAGYGCQGSLPVHADLRAAHDARAVQGVLPGGPALMSRFRC